MKIKELTELPKITKPSVITVYSLNPVKETEKPFGGKMCVEAFNNGTKVLCSHGADIAIFFPPSSVFSGLWIFPLASKDWNSRASIAHLNAFAAHLGIGIRSKRKWMLYAKSHGAKFV